MAKITTLYEDSAKTEALYPRTKVSAVSDGDNRSLEEIIDNLTLTAGKGISIENGKVSNTFSDITSGNANDITYNFQGYIANAVTNKPTTNGGGLCCIMNSGGSYGYQLFSPNGTENELYFRHLNNGTWKAWEKVHSPIESGNVTVISTAQSVSHHFYNIDGNLMTVGFKIQAPSGGFSNATTIFTLPYKAHSGGFVPVYVSSDTWLNSNVDIKYAFLTGGAATFQVSTIPANYWVMGYFTVIIDR